MKALNAVHRWNETGERVESGEYQTVFPEVESTIKFIEKNKAEATIKEVDIYGEVSTNITQEDMEKMGIPLRKNQNDPFFINFKNFEEEIPFFYSFHPFNGIDDLQFVATILGDGYLTLFVKTFDYHPLSEKFSLKKGDTFTFSYRPTKKVGKLNLDIFNKN